MPTSRKKYKKKSAKKRSGKKIVQKHSSKKRVSKISSKKIGGKPPNYELGDLVHYVPSKLTPSKLKPLSSGYENEIGLIIDVIPIKNIPIKNMFVKTFFEQNSSYQYTVILVKDIPKDIQDSLSKIWRMRYIIEDNDTVTEKTKKIKNFQNVFIPILTNSSSLLTNIFDEDELEFVNFHTFDGYTPESLLNWEPLYIYLYRYIEGSRDLSYEKAKIKFETMKKNYYEHKKLLDSL